MPRPPDQTLRPGSGQAQILGKNPIKANTSQVIFPCQARNDFELYVIYLLIDIAGEENQSEENWRPFGAKSGHVLL
jgi:hypothetical protein